MKWMRAGLALLLPAAVLPLGGEAMGQVPGEKVVSGIVVHVGVATSEQLSSRPRGHAEAMMHSPASRGERDHLVVALADARSGQRIDEATVVASVSRSGVDHRRRVLERMESPGAASYAGFFDFRQPGPYRIRIEVIRPGLPVPAVADFDYRPGWPGR